MGDPFEPVDGAYRTPAGRLIDVTAVTWAATRSGGPGGQHANTSDTAVTVNVEVSRTGLPDVVQARIVAAIGPVVSASSAGSRSQWRNRQVAWRTALERVDEAAAPPAPPRARTRPSRGAREDRLREKHQASQRKQARRRPSGDD